jgi:hypothetical protein
MNMTSQEKFSAIKKVEADFHIKMDRLRQEYRATIKDIVAKAEQRRIADIKQKLYK